MRRADQRAKHVRNEQTDEADDPAEHDRCADGDTHRCHDHGNEATGVEPEGEGLRIPEGEQIQSPRVMPYDEQGGDDGDRGDDECLPCRRGEGSEDEEEEGEGGGVEDW